jgi:hypothetical protein
MQTVQRMISTRLSRGARPDTSGMAECISDCIECAQTCVARAEACLTEKQVTELRSVSA